MQNAALQFSDLGEAIGNTIVGQQSLINRLLLAVLTNGHVLLEGPPGLAKTTAVKSLAGNISAAFQRIQFTPDLMPADITGSDIYDSSSGEFRFVPGPLFHQIVLADEINRAPPKVQSALLEAMEEHQVTVGQQTHQLDKFFLVIATQNPLEQAGTYPLPEAQLDRFQLHVVVDFPDSSEELEILNRSLLNGFSFPQKNNKSGLSPQAILAARELVNSIHVDESIRQYAVDLVIATRCTDELIPEMTSCVTMGASPRATLALIHCAMAQAFLNQRDYVIPEDVYGLAHDVLRHRLLMSFQALSANVGATDIIKRLLELVPVP